MGSCASKQNPDESFCRTRQLETCWTPSQPHDIPLLTPAASRAYVHPHPHPVPAHHTLPYPIRGGRSVQETGSTHPPIKLEAREPVFRGSPPTPLRGDSCENVFAALIPSDRRSTFKTLLLMPCATWRWSSGLSFNVTNCPTPKKVHAYPGKFQILVQVFASNS